VHRSQLSPRVDSLSKIGIREKSRMPAVCSSRCARTDVASQAKAFLRPSHSVAVDLVKSSCGRTNRTRNCLPPHDEESSTAATRGPTREGDCLRGGMGTPVMTFDPVKQDWRMPARSGGCLSVYCLCDLYRNVVGMRRRSVDGRPSTYLPWSLLVWGGWLCFYGDG
jgi:hypothetical protein